MLLDVSAKRVVGVSQRLTEEVNYCLPLTCSLCEQEKGKVPANSPADGVQTQVVRTIPVENIDQKSGTEFSVVQLPSFLH